MPNEIPASKIQFLRSKLDDPSPPVTRVINRRDAVLAKYTPIFSVDNLDSLDAETFCDFLKTEENGHWSGLERGKTKLTGDMSRLRAGLRVLLDESLPIDERIDRVHRGGSEAILGLGKATSTAILLVAYPDRYGPWNSVSIAGMKALGLRPKYRRGATQGERYALFNNVLLECAEQLDTDLWTLDALWLDIGTSYYKVAPGPSDKDWNLCREQGFIAVGWSELGDLSAADQDEFEQRRDALIEAHPDLTVTGLNQAWSFRSIPQGSKIVANDGTSRVLGIGTVTGDYYFADDASNAELKSAESYRHRLPVRWEDIEPFEVDQPDWKQTLIELDKETFEQLYPSNEQPGRSGFSQRTLELMTQIKREPVYSYVQENKDDFQRHVFQPFRKLMKEVARRLPPEIKAPLETKKNVFSRMNKNDFGQGGAWPFYWGAFYPHGRSRKEAIQFFCWMDADRFDCGLWLGVEAAAARANLETRVAQHREQIEQSSDLSDLTFGAGPWAEAVGEGPMQETSWNEYAANPAAFAPRAAVVESTAEFIARPFEEQVDRVVNVMKATFPLYLLATSDNIAPEPPDWPDEYPMDELCEELFLEQSTMERWLRALDRKGQAVFYGPPGTGKTYIAQHIARHLVGGTNGIVSLVQFHPAYSYEDFMQGIRPQTEDGALTYDREDGRFLAFCKEARKRADPCVFIIDEINRANLSQVFGELMYLLEYRDNDTELAGGATFSIPENVRIIGTMNTADRSIALVDHALRRRFAFLELRPDFDILVRYHEQGPGNFDCSGLIHVLQEVNAAIDDPDYHVGISFFFHTDLDQHIGDIWRLEIEPYLREYFFDQPGRVEDFRWDTVRPAILP